MCTDVKGLHHGAWAYLVLDSSYDTVRISIVKLHVNVVAC